MTQAAREASGAFGLRPPDSKLLATLRFTPCVRPDLENKGRARITPFGPGSQPSFSAGGSYP